MGTTNWNTAYFIWVDITIVIIYLWRSSSRISMFAAEWESSTAKMLEALRDRGTIQKHEGSHHELNQKVKLLWEGD